MFRVANMDWLMCSQMHITNQLPNYAAKSHSKAYSFE
jgi:hypothetical protein